MLPTCYRHSYFFLSLTVILLVSASAHGSPAEKPTPEGMRSTPSQKDVPEFNPLEQTKDIGFDIRFDALGERKNLVKKSDFGLRAVGKFDGLVFQGVVDFTDSEDEAKLTVEFQPDCTEIKAFHLHSVFHHDTKSITHDIRGGGIRLSGFSNDGNGTLTFESKGSKTSDLIQECTVTIDSSENDANDAVATAYDFSSGKLELIVPGKLSLEDVPEFRDFRGLDDQRVPVAKWPDFIDRCVADVVQTAIKYPGVHNRIEISGEQREIGRLLGIEFVGGFLSGGDLAQLFSMDDLPEEHRHDNPYAAATRDTEAKLRQAMLAAQTDSLLPKNVMRMSLDASGGSYPLAVLTAHAVLKTAAKKGRHDGIRPMYIRVPRSGQRWPKKVFGWNESRPKLYPHSEIAKRLRNLRPEGDTTGDKLGPWYHVFGVLSVGAMSSFTEANIGARGEHLLKYMKAFGQEGGFNAVKKEIDLKFAAATLTLTRLNRYTDRAPLTAQDFSTLIKESTRRMSIK